MAKKPVKGPKGGVRKTNGKKPSVTKGAAKGGKVLAKGQLSGRMR